MKKILGLFFTMILAVTLFACSQTTTAAPTTAAPTTAAPTTVAPTTAAPTTAAPTTVAPTTVAPTTVAPTTVAPTTAAPSTAVPKVLVVGYDPFSAKFSPFFSDTAYDADVVGMTQAGLLTTDRDGGIVYNAIDGETVPRGGVDYFYHGIANIGVNYDDVEGQTTYSIEIRSDIQFSDGEYMTADDIIFTYYVLLDPYYAGSSSLNSVNIVGLKNYKFNSTNVEAAEAQAAAGAQALLDNLGTVDEDPDFAALVWDVMYDGLNSEWDWVATITGSAAYLAAGYIRKEDGTAATTQAEASVAATLVFFYGLEALDVVGLTRDEVVSALTDQYELDYVTLDAYYGGAGYRWTAPEIEGLALDQAILVYLEDNPGDPVPNITGITKVSDTEVTVLVDGFDAAAVYQVCGISVAPMHYYGDEDLFDYANNEFGFNSRQSDSMALIQEKTSQPMGAGPYKFVVFDNNVVFFEANPYYYRGEPKTKFVNFQVVTEDGKISGIVTGDIDISNPSGSRVKFEEIDTINKYSDNSIYVSSIDNLGYGYFGINSMNVSVSEDADSPASIALRTAFAVVVAATRHTSINSYYGDAASIINYPISNTSWAAPKPGEDGYEIAFSKNPDGTAIYTADPATLAESVRLAAAKASAKLWLEAAGYVFTDTGTPGDFGGNVWTAVAPVGAKLDYEIIVPGGGTGDHPSYMIAVEMSNILAELGFTIEINDPANSNVLWDALDSVTQEMWVAAWGSTIDPDMYQVYHSNNIPVIVGGAANSTESNHYGITDAALDAKIMEARTSDDQAVRKALYKECLDIILDWAVEVPTYQRQNIIAFSTERVNMETVTPGITTYWGWAAEIELIEMN